MPVETPGSTAVAGTVDAPAPGTEAAAERTATKPAIKKTPIHSQLVYSQNLWGKAA
ncbi:hypothetical protein [Nonomuraea diastatica]|uniref:hypothetical protein n=1 Tax=Nonomuraea diastatica TaxID=1848329 RepID=UPI001408D020|nr:hypothetical protein [Nonomuraea diastatica]